MNEMKQKFTMFNMKAVVKRVVTHCRVCIIRRAKPVMPQMSALPLGRKALFFPPFTHTGVDYIGPIEVVVGRRREKRTGVLFTCLTTRLMYAEVAFSNSCESFMTVMDSLVARRGMPMEMYSDNATNFTAAAKEYVGPDQSGTLSHREAHTSVGRGNASSEQLSEH